MTAHALGVCNVRGQDFRGCATSHAPHAKPGLVRLHLEIARRAWQRNAPHVQHRLLPSQPQLAKLRRCFRRRRRRRRQRSGGPHGERRGDRTKLELGKGPRICTALSRFDLTNATVDVHHTPISSAHHRSSCTRRTRVVLHGKVHRDSTSRGRNARPPIHLHVSPHQRQTRNARGRRRRAHPARLDSDVTDSLSGELRCGSATHVRGSDGRVPRASSLPVGRHKARGRFARARRRGRLVRGGVVHVQVKRQRSARSCLTHSKLHGRLHRFPLRRGNDATAFRLKPACGGCLGLHLTHLRHENASRRVSSGTHVVAPQLGAFRGRDKVHGRQAPTIEREPQ